MSQQEYDNAIHMGGSIETALNGRYRLDPFEIIKEAFSQTLKHFWSFLPAALGLFATQIGILMLMLTLLLGAPSHLFEALVGQRELTTDMISSVWLANFTSEVLIAPLYAGASLMGLSHAIGFRSKPRHLLKGLAFALPVTVVICLSATLQSVASLIFPLLSLYVAMVFSMAPLLICEKRVTPMKALSVSFRAVNKKLFQMATIYAVVGVLFLISFATAGFALVWALPFLFNVKGVIYREMFGVGVEVTVSPKSENNPDKSNASSPSSGQDTFDA
ncbi:hypothetical protein BZG78_10570 [Salinivibrio sp. MA351]|uniref:Proline and glycine rich transmembrane protein gene in bax n=1 Tax=Salinivibrio costicola subsp. alcaliphilus TaxID=272773 RepID=A0ABX3KU78_SALCS|nr:MULTISPECIES: hypothetical protein [Salinivibrio]NUY55092.1 hypothetical protein [Salinivibrio sp. EAGSL]OOE97859.1 hypothetical protein BZG78_10570 [Salinivibrio sp. MA351]OOF01963.1 hypothetical protein BZG80_13875 [Salinivibrio sp. MA440]OOF06229.1 hypothetical protein BZG81_04175 [Salinivibrio sp. MA607]OOF16765.1 hypothetical protein BZG79_05450 [Salinivibrio sp. MA427]